MAMASLLGLLTLFILVNRKASADRVVFEGGYAVTTVIDGDKLGINPRSVLPLIGSSDLLVLDSSGSSIYTFSIDSSQVAVIKRVSGNGAEGYADGDLDSAMFKKPRSFAVDFKGNIYVADAKNHHAIRKITKSGVTTIAGGNSDKPGRGDGPAQNASFSDDFDLVFVPDRCALMISDHGNRLIREINLKSEDCARHSQSVLGMTSIWALGLVVSCMLGLIIGFVIRPYVGPTLPHFNATWKLFLISLWKRLLTLCFDIRSAIVSSTFYELSRRIILLSRSHLSLILNLFSLAPTRSIEKPVSLLDSDKLKISEITKSPLLPGGLGDLISFDEDKGNEILGEEEEEEDIIYGGQGKIEGMIEANIMGFEEGAQITSLPMSVEKRLGLVKRK